jgi:hypothetical protein
MNCKPRLAKFASIVILISLAGCSSRFARPNVPAVIVVPSPKVIPPPSATGNYTLGDYTHDLDLYSKATGTEALRLRNRMTYGLMAEIDYVFYEYETKLFLNQGGFNVGSDFLQLGLAAGSTITNGARAKTILSALLSGVTGTSLSIDKNFFRQQTVQAIMSSMEANRDRVKAVIIQQLAKDTSVYPFEAARPDLIKYFFAGTLPAGLQQLHQEAATDAKEQREELNRVQITNISAADAKTAGDVDLAVRKAFQSGDLSKVKTFLIAMGAVGDTATNAQLDAAVRELGRKILKDDALKKKYFEEAKKAGLIE